MSNFNNNIPRLFTVYPENVKCINKVISDANTDFEKVEIGQNNFIYNGDNISVLKSLLDNTADSFVADGPYGLKFMGKHWDEDVPSVELWREVFRVLKPGGYLLSFGSPKTYNRMASRIENAGFIIRDQILWVYGSGMPKSFNISKALDKIEAKYELDESTYIKKTEEVKKWSGWGTNLKPAHEPIVLAMKPCSENTIAENVLKWGTGDLYINQSKFFYCPKASKKDREEGLTIDAKLVLGRDPGQDKFMVPHKVRSTKRKNTHTTVKPTKLMQYLIRLVTPVSGTTIDPFFGSGSTGKAALSDGRYKFIGIEKEKEYYNIAVGRCIHELEKSKQFDKDKI